jgi:hypothetical protein
VSQGELVRLRRCRLLLLAMLFGIALPIFQPSWITVVVAVIGEVLLALAWWRRCRGLGGVLGTLGPDRAGTSPSEDPRG